MKAHLPRTGDGSLRRKLSVQGREKDHLPKGLGLPQIPRELTFATCAAKMHITTQCRFGVWFKYE